MTWRHGSKSCFNLLNTRFYTIKKSIINNQISRFVSKRKKKQFIAGKKPANFSTYLINLWHFLFDFSQMKKKILIFDCKFFTKLPLNLQLHLKNFSSRINLTLKNSKILSPESYKIFPAPTRKIPTMIEQKKKNRSI